MPIGFSDLLKTTAQLDNNLTKGIVSTDDTFGGIRSKIDDWTDLHTSTYNSGSGYTFQDDGTGAAPGHFKAYSTMFYVADGRALVETNDASGAIMLDSNGEFVSAGGQLYTHGGGTAEPEYWVLSDPTQVGGTGSGTDKLPKFTITGTQGSGSTALPAGYQKLQVLTNAAPSTGAVSLSSDLDNNLLSNTNGELGLDNQNANIVFAGPSAGGAAAPTFRSLVSADIPDNAANTSGTAGSLASAGTITFTGDVTGGTTPTYTSGGNLSIAMTIQPDSVGLGDLVDITDERLLGRIDNADGSVAELTASQVRTMLNVENGAQANVSGNNGNAAVYDNSGTPALKTGITAAEMRSVIGAGTISTQAANSVDIDGGAIDGTTIGANTAAAGSFTTITASSNVTITGNLTVSGDVVQANSTTVDFEDAVLALGVPRDSSNVITNGTSTIDTGLNFVKVTAGDAITQFSAFRYDISADKFKFTRHADAGNFSEAQVISGSDNVLALKFDRTVTGQAVDSADVTDVYATNSSAVSNDETARSLGAVARCRITITTESTDGSSNFAPVSSAAAGYPIKHGLGTQAVFVVAIKDPAGTPTPVFCKYTPKSNDVAVVSVGITAEDEVYDIIVIG